ncbi:uncharacterized protein LOC108849653 [Raphanus sativus]|uniref:Uncharacterized protein LOC108849653 n=1 Tax=Raphanus sativus TaxID=3726 RepID=A0A6J0N262_RAPSA|nr:uncharacterized protein LOC108849653 [Raphanus sativus]
MAILSYLLFTVDNSCNSYAATLSPTFLALIPEINSTTQISSSFFCNLRPYLQSFFTVVDPWLNLVGLLQHSVRCDSSTGIFLSCVSRYTFLLLAQTSSFSFSVLVSLQPFLLFKTFSQVTL